MTSEKELNKTGISILPEKKKVLTLMIIKMLTHVRRRIDGHSENFNKE